MINEYEELKERKKKVYKLKERKINSDFPRVRTESVGKFKE